MKTECKVENFKLKDSPYVCEKKSDGTGIFYLTKTLKISNAILAAP